MASDPRRRVVLMWAAVALAVVGLVACSGDDADTAGRVDPELRSVLDDAGGSFVGRAGDKFVALVTGPGGTIVYVCDSKKVSEWFRSDERFTGTALTLHSPGGSSLLVAANGREIEGALAPRRGSSIEVSAHLAEDGVPVLYRAVATSGEGNDLQGVLAGWVVDGDEQRGGVDLGPGVKPAPPLTVPGPGKTGPQLTLPPRATSTTTTRPSSSTTRATTTTTTFVSPVKPPGTPAVVVPPRGPTIALTPFPVTPAALGKPRPNSNVFVVVGLGDSYGSGEGNPTTPGQYEDDGTFDPDFPHFEEWGNGSGVEGMEGINETGNVRCHRSDESGSAKAARALQADYPQIRVIYTSFACSGAKVEHLHSEGYAGIAPRAGDADLPPQTAQLAAWRTQFGVPSVNAFLISAGGNNAHFADVVAKCISPIEGSCDENADLEALVNDGIGILPDALDDLASSLRAGFPGAAVVMTEYPHLTNRQFLPTSVEPGGSWCGGDNNLTRGAMAGDLMNNMTRVEAEWAETTALPGFNDVIADAVVDHVNDRWHVTTGVLDASFGRGICTTRSGFNTNNVALRRQGRDDSLGQPGIVNVSDGVAHPNDEGFQLYGTAYRAALEPIVVERFRPAPPAGLSVVTAALNGNIKLRWNDQSTSETLHLVTARPVSGAAPVTFTVSGENVQEATHVLTRPSTFKYSVQACWIDQNRCSAPSNIVIGSNTPPQGVPSNVAATVTTATASSRFVNVTWTRSSTTNATFDAVEYTVNNGAVVRVRAAFVGRHRLTVLSGRTVRIKVRHCTMLNGGTCGTPSAQKVVTT